MLTIRNNNIAMHCHLYYAAAEFWNVETSGQDGLACLSPSPVAATSSLLHGPSSMPIGHGRNWGREEANWWQPLVKDSSMPAFKNCPGSLEGVALLAGQHQH